MRKPAGRNSVLVSVPDRFIVAAAQEIAAKGLILARLDQIERLVDLALSKLPQEKRHD